LPHSAGLEANREIAMPPAADFAAFRAAHPGRGFCDWLRHASGPLWDAMVGHRFTRDMAGDRLPSDAFLRYLRYEHSFVRTAVQIFAHALIAAPTAKDRVHVVRILDGLVGEQEAYFARQLAALDVGAGPLPAASLPDAVLALSEGALAIAAHGGFEEILSAMLAAEWMYHAWCTAAQAAGPRRPGPADWIALHVAPGFADGVAWTKARVDALGPPLDPWRQARCAASFARMLRLEIAFHDAPYGSSGSSDAAAG
jgi:thiaminase/transcriptional activator TenA